MKNTILFLGYLCLLSLSSSLAANDTFDISKYKGKVVYVDFWASWCTPCRASFPFMQKLAEQYGDALVIAAINVDKNRTDAELFLEHFEVDFQILYDPLGSLAEAFDVKGMPTSYLYNRQGQLVGTHIGFKSKDMGNLETAIAKEIGSRDPVF